jgi:hypothetical protein
MPFGDLVLASSAKTRRPSDFLIPFSPRRRKGADVKELHSFFETPSTGVPWLSPDVIVGAQAEY